MPNGFITLSHAWRERTYDMGDFTNTGDKQQPQYRSTDVSINYNLKNVSKFEKVAFRSDGSWRVVKTLVKT